jgi:hypothetical protein
MANSEAIAFEFPSILFSNEFSAPKEETKIRWAMLAPYGDWPNKQGLQRLEKADAQNIVNEFKKVTSLPKRVLGLPWYIGHPDHPAFNERYKDTKAYGRIKDLEARDDGLWAGVRFGSEGESMIADEAFGGHSVNWFLKEDPNEKGVWRPVRLKSVGFTNEPNIPVPPVTAANEAQQATQFKRLARLRLFGNVRKDFVDEAEAATKAAFKATAKAATTNDPGDHEEAVKAHIDAKKLNDASSKAQGGCPIRDAACEQHAKMAQHHLTTSKKAGQPEDDDAAKAANAANEFSTNDVREKLQSVLNNDARFKKAPPAGRQYPGSIWITDVFAPETVSEPWSVICQCPDDLYYRHEFTVKAGEIVLAEGDPKQVERKTVFEPVANEDDKNEGAADAPMKAARRMANMRRVRSMVDEKEGTFKGGMTAFVNSFGPWENFDACLVHMEGKGGYDEDTAKKICGKLQLELED